MMLEIARKNLMYGIAALLMSLLLVSSSNAQIVFDFEDGSLDDWVIVDEEPQNLGDQGPSSWEIRESELDLEGNVLYQGSNIWGEPEDHMLLGTIIYYGQEEFTNFRVDVDVVANDNDGMGLVWGYNDLTSHYRVMMMNDRWPELPPIDGHNGPMIIAHERISDETPWYEVLEVDDVDYIPYPQGFAELLHWTLEVVDGNFTFTSTDSFGDENVISGFDDTISSGFVGIQLYAQQAEFDNFTITPLGGATRLQAGDANQDFNFNQVDLVQVQIAAKYLTGAAATWGEGDWDGAPGGEAGMPPAGDGRFNQLDIIAALNANVYLTGPYAAIAGNGDPSDEQTSIVYDPSTGELAVNAPASTQLTSVNIDSAGAIFTGDAAMNLGGSFDNDSDNNIFKATFGSSFGSLSFSNVAQTGLSEEFVRNDLTVIGSLAGGGDLGNVDLIYVPEPTTAILAGLGLLGLAGIAWKRRVS
jgi:hypothetical protein